jgi:membrane protein YqaA with SNARE-associated domain
VENRRVLGAILIVGGAFLAVILLFGIQVVALFGSRCFFIGDDVFNAKCIPQPIYFGAWLLAIVLIVVGILHVTRETSPTTQSQARSGSGALRRLYDWTLSLAARKSAEWWLFFIAFVESSVFVIPAEVLFIPMGLARPERAYRYAVIATVGSVLGAIFAYEFIARPMLEFYGSIETFEKLRNSSSRDAVLLMLITSGLAHLPPMKVVSIVSGALSVDLWLFVVSSIVARGIRFAIFAWLLRRYGEPIRDFIEKRLGLIAAVAAAVVIVLYFGARYLLKHAG